MNRPLAIAIYDGRLFLGEVRSHHGHFDAIDADGDLIDTCATERDVVSAVCQASRK